MSQEIQGEECLVLLCHEMCLCSNGLDEQRFCLSKHFERRLEFLLCLMDSSDAEVRSGEKACGLIPSLAPDVDGMCQKRHGGWLIF